MVLSGEHRSTKRACIDKLKKYACLFLRQRLIADFIKKEYMRLGKPLKFAFCFSK